MIEKSYTKNNGGLMVFLTIVAFLAIVALFLYSLTLDSGVFVLGVVIAVLAFIVWTFLPKGFFTVQPNEAVVLTLFGKYKGTIKQDGLFWTNPFYVRRKVSMRVRNFTGDTLKVNDKAGNPIEIAAVIVWHVSNAAAAMFDVENYITYVSTQSESALRHMAGMYPYDADEENTVLSLRGSTDEVSSTLKVELSERLACAGVVVDECRLSHLAYAPEIAAVMLQRQQATAIIAARTKIVDGAVGMVEQALKKLNQDGIVNLEGAQKAAMVSNLLVVLCGERGAQPVLNTSTMQ